MGRLTQWAVIEADIAVRRMSHDQKVRLADEIYAQQPNMLASILALPSMGVDMAQLEVALHILMVTFQAMKLSGHPWPLVTEDIQDGCLQRLTARARFNEGLPERNWRPRSSNSSTVNMPSATYWPSSMATLASMT
jgi:hypothetical protein